MTAWDAIAEHLFDVNASCAAEGFRKRIWACVEGLPMRVFDERRRDELDSDCCGVAFAMPRKDVAAGVSVGNGRPSSFGVYPTVSDFIIGCAITRCDALCHGLGSGIAVFSDVSNDDDGRSFGRASDGLLLGSQVHVIPASCAHLFVIRHSPFSKIRSVSRDFKKRGARQAATEARRTSEGK